MSWTNGSTLDAGSEQAHARNKRLALIKRRHQLQLRRQAALERFKMEGAIEELDDLLDAP